MIDLRSDTVTKPTAKMRAAMAAAEVGDDVYGEDPTVNLLESRAAEIFGREAALFVPTGSMGNQIAMRLHTAPGMEAICEARAHVLEWEMAMAAAFSGVQLRTVEAERGVMRWSEIALRISPRDLLYSKAQTALVWLENTHNMAGGTVTPLHVMEEVWEGAREAGLKTHLDGARIFNAAAALGRDVQTLTRGFDTVMFCLSKGLGAPVGSMLVGSRELMSRARTVRKALGGGMRQAGVLAAAGLIALEEMPGRLSEDHSHARLIAETVAHHPHCKVDLGDVETNMVFITVKNGKAAELVAALKEQGVLVGAVGTDRVRMVTHYDVSRVECERAAKILLELLGSVAA